MHTKTAPAYPDYLTIVVYILNVVMFCVLTIFFRFHVKLIVKNLTTLEHMDRKRDPLLKKEANNVRNFGELGKFNSNEIV